MPNEAPLFAIEYVTVPLFGPVKFDNVPVTDAAADGARFFQKVAKGDAFPDSRTPLGSLDAGG